MRRSLLVSVAVVVLAGVVVSLAAGGASSPTGRWVMRELGTLGGPSSSAVAINERGQIVGAADTKATDADGDPVHHAFLWQNGTMRDLGTLGGPGSWAVANNERGQIVGAADTKARDADGDPMEHAFLWQNGTMRDLGTLGGPESKASGINERGQIIGTSDTKARDADGYPIEHAFLWQSGKMRDLGPLAVRGINDRGQVILNRWSRPRAFLWQGGTMRGLGTLGGPESLASDINESGMIVGYATTRDRLRGLSIHHAFLWQNGKMRDLGPSRRATSGATLVNDRGDVVLNVMGDTVPIPGTPGAFTWQESVFLWRNGKMTGLGVLEGSRMLNPFALNDKGQIVGFAEMGDGSEVIRNASVWEKGTVTKLDALAGDTSYADDINERGQIVGSAQLPDSDEGWAGQLRAVVWTKTG